MFLLCGSCLFGSEGNISAKIDKLECLTAARFLVLRRRASFARLIGRVVKCRLCRLSACLLVTGGNRLSVLHARLHFSAIHPVCHRPAHTQLTSDSVRSAAQPVQLIWSKKKKENKKKSPEVFHFVILWQAGAATVVNMECLQVLLPSSVVLCFPFTSNYAAPFLSLLQFKWLQVVTAQMKPAGSQTCRIRGVGEPEWIWKVDELFNVCLCAKPWGDNWGKNKQATGFLKDFSTQQWTSRLRHTSFAKRICQTFTSVLFVSP